MAWEVLAIWAIILVTTVWFARDERRSKREALEALAKLYATAPAYRHRLATVVASRPAPPQRPVSEADAAARRRFLASLQR